MPKITEMSFVSVPRELFVEALNQMAIKAELDDSIIVRLAANVHTRQLNPNITDSEWDIYTNCNCNFFYLKLEH